MDKCKDCGMYLVKTENGMAHEGGGIEEQMCQSCNWKGGQIGGFTACPRCGDMTSLKVTHKAN